MSTLTEIVGRLVQASGGYPTQADKQADLDALAALEAAEETAAPAAKAAS